MAFDKFARDSLIAQAGNIASLLDTIKRLEARIAVLESTSTTPRNALTFNDGTPLRFSDGGYMEFTA